MGFDLSGMNPNVSGPQPELPPMGKDWGDKEKKMYSEYEAWQDENCGVYFRNNVWWWRPLWHFVTATCDNILTEGDMESGSMNDGHKISKTKAVKVANKLHSMIKSGEVKKYEEMHTEYINSLEQVDCEICDATGKRQEPPKSGAGDMECNGCNGTGKKDDWAKSYPFSEDNVRQFANFCANSGGFTIC